MISALGPHQIPSESFSWGDRGRPISQAAFYWLVVQRPSCYPNHQTTVLFFRLGTDDIEAEMYKEVPCEHRWCAKLSPATCSPGKMFATNSSPGFRLQRRSVNSCAVKCLRKSISCEMRQLVKDRKRNLDCMCRTGEKFGIETASPVDYFRSPFFCCYCSSQKQKVRMYKHH